MTDVRLLGTRFELAGVAAQVTSLTGGRSADLTDTERALNGGCPERCYMAGAAAIVAGLRSWPDKGLITDAADEGLSRVFRLALEGAEEHVAAVLEAMGAPIECSAAVRTWDFKAVPAGESHAASRTEAAELPRRVSAELGIAEDAALGSVERSAGEFVDNQVRLRFRLPVEGVSDQLNDLAIVCPNDTRAGIKEKLGHVIDIPALVGARAEHDTDTKRRAVIDEEGTMGGFDLPAYVVLRLPCLLGRVDLPRSGHGQPRALLGEGFAFEDAVDADAGLSDSAGPRQDIQPTVHIVIIPLSGPKVIVVLRSA